MFDNIPNRASYDWRRIPANARDKWYVGCDLGQSTDPTAICVMHHRVVPLDTWTPSLKGKFWKQDRTNHFDVRHLERLPLGMSYPVQVQRVADILARPPLSACSPTLVIDDTGVGKAVGDIFETAGMRPTRITITAGSEVTHHGSGWHVAKGRLISNLDALLHLGELKIAAGLSEAGALAEELKDFQRKVSDAGRATYSARVGAHDDLVLSIAIAAWFAASGPTSSSASMFV